MNYKEYNREVQRYKIYPKKSCKIDLSKETKTLKILDIIDNDDDTCTMHVELDDEFKEWFKETQDLKRWSQKRFQYILIKAIAAIANKEKNK